MSQLDFLCSQGNYFFLIYSSLLTFYYLNRTLFSKFIFIFYFNFISFGESNKKLNFILFFLFSVFSFYFNLFWIPILSIIMILMAILYHYSISSNQCLYTTSFHNGTHILVKEFQVSQIHYMEYITR